MNAKKLMSRLESPVRNNVLTGLFLFVVFALVHGSVVIYERGIAKDALQGASLEDLNKVEGDHTFYRNAVLSILHYNFTERVTQFHSSQFNLGQRFIREGSIGTLESSYATFYPYPPGRAGFAWTGALLSFFVPKVFFEKVVSRIVFINLILTLVVALLLYWLALEVTQRKACAALAAFLFLTDVTLLHTNYHSQSPTLAGIFWVLGALLAYLKRVPQILSGFALSLSLHCSPHLLPWVAAMGLVLVIKNDWKNRFWFLSGGLLPSLYLVSVDGILNLKGRGIPGYVDHIEHLLTQDGGVVQSVPFHLRWMWDLRVIQPGILYFLAFIGMALFIYRKKIQTIWIELNKELLFTLLGVLSIGSLLSFFVSLPIIRVLLPFMTFFSLFLGLLFGVFWSVGISGRVGVAIFCVLWVGSSVRAFDWIQEKPKKQPAHFISLDDRPAMGQNHALYFHHIRSGSLTPFRHKIPFKYWTHSVSELVKELEKEPIPKEDLFVELRPTYLVDAYAATNRFYPKMVNRPWHGLTPDVLAHDFQLYNELMSLIDEKKLGSNDVLEIAREKWELGHWDHETGYWLKYKNGFRAFAKGLPLEKLDMRKLYYFKYSALKKIAG